MANAFMKRQDPITWLEVARRVRGWSMTDVCSRIGVGTNTYKAIEAGKIEYVYDKKRTDVKRLIEETFGLPIEVLLSLVPDPTTLVIKTSTTNTKDVSEED